MKRFWMSMLPVIVVCAAVSAQEEKQPKDTVARSLEEAVITAQRKGSLPLRIPYTVERINSRQLAEHQPRTTPEALVRMNGVFVQKTNHGGGSPFIRGLTGNQVLVLVDGIRLNNSTCRYGPNQYLNTVDAYSIQTIEVAKGTGSVQYGSDAVGGVVQVLTKEPSFSTDQKEWTGKVTGKYMSGNMEKTGRGEWMYRDNQFAVQGGLTFRNFGDLIGGDTTGRQSPSGYTEMAADLKLKIKISNNWQLIAAHQSLAQQHVPVYHKLILENFAVNEMDPQKRMLSYARLKGTTENRMVRQMEITASWQKTTEGRNSRKTGSTILRKEKEQVNTLGLTAELLSQPNQWWSANSGIELYRDKVNSTREDLSQVNFQSNSLRGLYPDRSTYGSYSLYSLHHFQFNQFVAELGGRFNVFDIRISDTTLGAVKLHPSAFVGNAALLYQLDRQQSIYTSVSSGYRAPNIDDMGTLGIVDFRYEIPAARLEPEQSIHTEIGYKFSHKKIKGSINLYRLQLGNIITRTKMEGQVINGYPVYQKENSERARIKGIEAEMSWQVHHSLAIYGGCSYAQGDNLTKSEPLRRIPPFHGRGMSTYRTKQYFFTAEWMFASRQARLASGDADDNRIPAGGTPGWNIVNIYSGFTASRLQLQLGLQNLFNADYRTHGSGINAVGRSILISVSANL